MKLEEIASIEIGKSLQRIQQSTNVYSKLFRIIGSCYNYDELKEINLESNVNKGIIIMSLVNNFISMEIKHDDIFVNNHFAIIDSRKKDYLNGFLSIYLNSLDVQRKLHIVSLGWHSVTTLPRKYLREIEIPSVSLKEQNNIIAIHDYRQQLRELHKKKETLLENLIKGVLSESINHAISQQDIITNKDNEGGA